MGKANKKQPNKPVINNSNSSSIESASIPSENETNLILNNDGSENSANMNLSLLQEYSRLNNDVINLKSDIQSVRAITLRSKEFYESSTELMKICRVVIYLAPMLLYGIFAIFLFLNSSNKVVNIITIIFSMIVGISTIADMIYVAITQKITKDSINDITKRMDEIERVLEENKVSR